MNCTSLFVICDDQVPHYDLRWSSVEEEHWLPEHWVCQRGTNLLIWFDFLNISCHIVTFVLHFQNLATFCLFPGFESQIVCVISDIVFVFALLLAAENSSDYSVSWGISVFKPCWQLSPEKIQCMKERSVKEKTRDSDWKKDVLSVRMWFARKHSCIWWKVSEREKTFNPH